MILDMELNQAQSRNMARIAQCLWTVVRQQDAAHSCCGVGPGEFELCGVVAAGAGAGVGSYRALHLFFRLRLLFLLIQLFLLLGLLLARFFQLFIAICRQRLRSGGTCRCGRRCGCGRRRASGFFAGVSARIRLGVQSAAAVTGVALTSVVPVPWAVLAVSSLLTTGILAGSVFFGSVIVGSPDFAA